MKNTKTQVAEKLKFLPANSSWPDSGQTQLRKKKKESRTKSNSDLNQTKYVTLRKSNLMQPDHQNNQANIDNHAEN